MVVFVVVTVVLAVLLVLLVRVLPRAPRAEPIVPRTPRFDVPTQTSVVPLTEADAGEGAAHRLDQEDLLQVEAVVDAERASVEATLEQVRACARDQHVEGGYARVVVRPAIGTPLRAAGIHRRALELAFPAVPGGALPLLVGPRGGTHSRVVSGFAWQVSGLGVVYGATDEEGYVTLLGLDRLQATPTEPARLALRSFCASHGVAFVDWLAQRWL